METRAKLLGMYSSHSKRVLLLEFIHHDSLYLWPVYLRTTSSPYIAHQENLQRKCFGELKLTSPIHGESNQAVAEAVITSEVINWGRIMSAYLRLSFHRKMISTDFGAGYTVLA